MSIILNPISLRPSQWLEALTTFINEMRVINNIETYGVMNKLVDSCRIGKVETGKGIVHTFKKELLEVQTYSKVSSAFKVTDPSLAQETILIDTYNFIPVSWSEIKLRDAIPSMGYSNELLGLVQSLIEDTYTNYMYKGILELYNEYAPVLDTQTIAISQIDVDELESPSEINNANQLNATTIARKIYEQKLDMEIITKQYTDNSVIGSTDKSSFKMVFNANFYSNYLANALAKFFNEDELKKMIEVGELIILPQSQFVNKKIIAFMHEKRKFALADFYKISGNIFDPSNLYTNTFMHFSYGLGVFESLQGVIFIEA